MRNQNPVCYQLHYRAVIVERGLVEPFPSRTAEDLRGVVILCNSEMYKITPKSIKNTVIHSTEGSSTPE
jgi:hypothetical protein